jgi:hypothetical protein
MLTAMTKMTMAQAKPIWILEPPGLEHGDTQAGEHGDADGQEDAPDDSHARSRAQISPGLATTNATAPITAKKAAAPALSIGVSRAIRRDRSLIEAIQPVRHVQYRPRHCQNG